MSPTEFTKLYDISKGMKCDILHIYINAIIGTESSYSTLTEVLYDTKIEGSYEIDKASFKLINDKCDELIKNNSEFNYLNEISLYATREYSMSQLENTYFSIQSILNNRLVPDYEVYNLKADNEFAEILAYKSSDGAKIFKINKKYLLTIYNGLLPINKSDKVNLQLYDIDQYSYLAKFIINKGKYTINKYIKYLFI